MRKHMAISMTAGAALSVLALYLAVRNVRFTDLADYLFRIQYVWTIPSFLLLSASYVCRVIRWKIILSSTKRLSFWSAFHPMTIGFMLNCILPARVGEIARPVILKSRDGIPFTTGLATVAVERVLDVLMLITSFAFVTLFIRIDPAASNLFGDTVLSRETLAATNRNMILFCLVMVFGILLVAYNPTRRWINRRIMGCPNLLFGAGENFRDRIRRSACLPVCKLIDNIAQGFMLIKEPVKMIHCLVLSILLWLLMGLSYHLLAFGFPGVELSFMEMFTVMILICFFVALPSVPGFWGLWEAGGVFAMALFGVPEKEALGFTLFNHIFQVFPCILVGILSAFICGIGFSQLRRLSTDDDVLKSEDRVDP